MNLSDSLPGVTESSNGVVSLTKALVAAQAAFPSIDKGGDNKFGKYAYMRYSDIAEAVREPLNKNGLALPQVMLAQRGESWVAVGVLRHISGEFVTATCPIFFPVDKEGHERRDMQSLGAAYTYAKKYLLLGLVGAWAEEDDDAQSIKSEGSKSKPKGQDRGRMIEQAAKSEIDKADDADAVQAVLQLLKLRVSEGVIDNGVLARCRAHATAWKEARNVGNE